MIWSARKGDKFFITILVLPGF